MLNFNLANENFQLANSQPNILTQNINFTHSVFQTRYGLLKIGTAPNQTIPMPLPRGQTHPGRPLRKNVLNLGQ